MRAGPLSDQAVINLLNHYFVPVYSSNEDSGPQGTGAPEEKAEHIRIYREAMRSPCGAGAVFVFVLDPEGHVIGGMDAAHASRGNALVQMLQGVVDKLHTTAGPPAVKPTPQSQPPRAEGSSLVLHLTARSFRKVAPWGEVPGENWIVLSRVESEALLPSGEWKVGSSWSVPDLLTRRLLSNFYPPMEDIDTRDDRSRIEKASLGFTVISVTPEVVQLRLDGTLKMKRTFYARRNDNNFVEAIVIGLLEFDAVSRRINEFSLVTEKATYGPSNALEFGVGLSLVKAQILASHPLERKP
jgi:hypothetical protein